MIAFQPHTPVVHEGVRTKLRYILPGCTFSIRDVSYLAELIETPFVDVPIGGRYRHQNAWLQRESSHMSRILDPNLPFGQPFDKPMSNLTTAKLVLTISIKLLGTVSVPKTMQ